MYCRSEMVIKLLFMDTIGLDRFGVYLDAVTPMKPSFDCNVYAFGS